MEEPGDKASRVVELQVEPVKQLSFCVNHEVEPGGCYNESWISLPSVRLSAGLHFLPLIRMHRVYVLVLDRSVLKVLVPWRVHKLSSIFRHILIMALIGMALSRNLRMPNLLRYLPLLVLSAAMMSSSLRDCIQER